MDLKKIIFPLIAVITLVAILYILFTTSVYYRDFCEDCSGESCPPSGPISLFSLIVKSSNDRGCVTLNSSTSNVTPHMIALVVLGLAFVSSLFYSFKCIARKFK